MAAHEHSAYSKLVTPCLRACILISLPTVWVSRLPVYYALLCDFVCNYSCVYHFSLLCFVVLRGFFLGGCCVLLFFNKLPKSMAYGMPCDHVSMIYLESPSSLCRRWRGNFVKRYCDAKAVWMLEVNFYDDCWNVWEKPGKQKMWCVMVCLCILWSRYSWAIKYFDFMLAACLVYMVDFVFCYSYVVKTCKNYFYKIQSYSISNVG